MHTFCVTFKNGYLSSVEKAKKPICIQADDFTLEKTGNEWGWFLFTKDGEAVAQIGAYEVLSVTRVDSTVPSEVEREAASARSNTRKYRPSRTVEPELAGGGLTGV